MGGAGGLACAPGSELRETGGSRRKVRRAHSDGWDETKTSYRLVHVKNPKFIPPANAHAVFSIWTLKFCKRLLCALAKTSPVFFFSRLTEFSSVKVYRKMWVTLAQLFSAKTKTKQKNGSQTSG